MSSSENLAKLLESLGAVPQSGLNGAGTCHADRHSAGQALMKNARKVTEAIKKQNKDTSVIRSHVKSNKRAVLSQVGCAMRRRRGLAAQKVAEGKSCNF